MRTESRTRDALTARSRRTRILLVKAVRSELRTEGTFHAETVASRAGCSPATFYSHFGTKNDALSAAFEQSLEELVGLTTSRLTLDRFERLGIEKVVIDAVEADADFFGRESNLFRNALARIAQHRPLRVAYRVAEETTLAHLRIVFAQAQEVGLVRSGPVDVLATAFMVLSQGINNAHMLRPDAAPLRAEVALAIASLLYPHPEES